MHTYVIERRGDINKWSCRAEGDGSGTTEFTVPERIENLESEGRGTPVRGILPGRHWNATVESVIAFAVVNFVKIKDPCPVVARPPPDKREKLNFDLLFDESFLRFSS